MAAELCVIWAVAMYLASLGAALYAIVISVAAHVMVVHIEEPELLERFGADYAEYCRNVPRWIPRLGQRG
jgi:protein-S-isoprenylcysteine O-methyltransferase Ste14